MKKCFLMFSLFIITIALSKVLETPNRPAILKEVIKHAIIVPQANLGFEISRIAADSNSINLLAKQKFEEFPSEQMILNSMQNDSFYQRLDLLSTLEHEHF